MSNLVQELGSGYVRDFFHNSLFVVGDRLHRLVDVTEETAVTQSIDLKSAELPSRWTGGTSVPVAQLADFTAFRHPKLGYRQVSHDVIGNFVVHLSSHRSTQRGFRPELCKIMWLPIFDVFPDYCSKWSETPHCQQAKEIFVPTFTPFAEGMQKLTSGEWLGFAMSEDIAIGMSVHNDEDRGFDIYFRGRVVGNVGKDGKANISSSILKRDAIKSKWFK